MFLSEMKPDEIDTIRPYLGESIITSLLSCCCLVIYGDLVQSSGCADCRQLRDQSRRIDITWKV
jgi:hypothetical protein